MVAVTVVAEVRDFRRFANARQLVAYLGLVPSEHSSAAALAAAEPASAIVERSWTGAQALLGLS